MRRRYNRIGAVLSAVLLGVCLLSGLTLTTAAVGGSCGDDVRWTLQNGVLSITGSGPMTDYTEQALPPWQEQAAQIQRITVGKGVTRVGDMAFYHCTALAVVSLHDSVTQLGELALAGCTSLKQIAMNGVQVIERGCFYGCTALATVVLPSGLQTLEKEAFYRCKALGGITVPASVQQMGTSVFAYCGSLKSARILAPITELPYWTFYGCVQLTDLYLPPTLDSVGEKALVECPNLLFAECDGSQAAKDEIQRQLNQPSTQPQDETVKSDVTYTESEDATITVTDKVQVGLGSPSTGGETGTTVDATVTGPPGWNDVVQEVIDTMQDGTQPEVTVQLPNSSTVPSGALAGLSDRDVSVTIQTSDNVEWKVELDDQTTDTLNQEQQLGVSITPNSSDKYASVIGDAESYVVSLNKTGWNSTLSLPLGTDAARKTATLYVISGGKPKKLSSVIVDTDGKASFRLAGTEKGQYLLALNVANIPKDEVLVPDKLASEYDITYGATLTDSQGNQYVLIGRVNKLGFGLGTLTLIIVGVLVGSTVLVGAVMLMWNKQKGRAIPWKMLHKK